MSTRAELRSRIHGYIDSLRTWIRVTAADATRNKVTLRADNDLKLVVYPYEKTYRTSILHREEDAGPFAVMRRLLKPGDTVLDIGANLGVYCGLASRLVGKEGRVYAFEPVPATYRRLLETLAVNRCSNVIPVPAAVGDRVGSAQMYLFPTSPISGFNSLLDNPRHNAYGVVVKPDRHVAVEIITLDRFATDNAITDIAFCKIDVEGAELPVLHGAIELLRQGRIRLICFEICEGTMGATTPSEVFGFIAGHGYSLHRDRGNGYLSNPLDPSMEEHHLFHQSRRPYFGNYFAKKVS